MLQGPDGSLASPHDSGDLVHRQVGHDAQQDHLGLSRGQRGDPGEGRPGADREHDVVLGVSHHGVLGDEVGWARLGATPTRASAQVDQVPCGVP